MGPARHVMCKDYAQLAEAVYHEVHSVTKKCLPRP